MKLDRKTFLLPLLVAWHGRNAVGENQHLPVEDAEFWRDYLLTEKIGKSNRNLREMSFTQAPSNPASSPGVVCFPTSSPFVAQTKIPTTVPTRSPASVPTLQPVLLSTATPVLPDTAVPTSEPSLEPATAIPTPLSIDTDGPTPANNNCTERGDSVSSFYTDGLSSLGGLQTAVVLCRAPNGLLVPPSTGTGPASPSFSVQDAINRARSRTRYSYYLYIVTEPTEEEIDYYGLSANCPSVVAVYWDQSNSGSCCARSTGCPAGTAMEVYANRLNSLWRASAGGPVEIKAPSRECVPGFTAPFCPSTAAYWVYTSENIVYTNDTVVECTRDCGGPLCGSFGLIGGTCVNGYQDAIN